MNVKNICGRGEGVANRIYGKDMEKRRMVLHIGLDHSDGHFFKTMEWSMVFQKKPL